MKRVITPVSLFGVATAALFLIVEVLAVLAAVLWALIGMGELSKTAAIVLIVVAALPTLWLCVAIIRMAYDAETDPMNN